MTTTSQTVTLIFSTDKARTLEAPVSKVGAAHIVVRIGDADVRFARKTGIRVGGTHTRGVGYDDWMIAPEALSALTGEPVVASKFLPVDAENAAEAAEARVDELNAQVAQERKSATTKAPRRAKATKPAEVAPEAPAEAPAPAPHAALFEAPASEVDQNAVETIPAPAETPAPVAPAPDCKRCHAEQMIAADEGIGGEFFGPAEFQAQNEARIAAGPHTCAPETEELSGEELEFWNKVDSAQGPTSDAPEAPASFSDDFNAPEAPEVLVGATTEQAQNDDSFIQRMLGIASENIGKVRDPAASAALFALRDAVDALMTRGATPAVARAAKAPKAPREASAPATERAPRATSTELSDLQRKVMRWTGEKLAKVRLAAGDKSTVTADQVLASGSRWFERLPESKHPMGAEFAAGIANAIITNDEPPPARKSTPPAPKAERPSKPPPAAPLTVGAKVCIKPEVRASYEDVLGLSQMDDLEVLALSGKHARLQTATKVVLPKVALADLALATV